VLSTLISRSSGCVAALFLLAPLGNSCTIVRTRSPFPDLRAPIRLEIAENGRALDGATVELFLGQPSPLNDLPYETLATSSDGSVVTSDLSVATYYIRVHPKGHPSATFSVSVPLQSRKQDVVDNLQFMAEPLKPSEQAWEQNESCPDATCSSRAAEGLQAELRDVRGVVMDPSDAVIPMVEVDVYRGRNGEQLVAHLRTDYSGRFSTDLAPGAYVVTFRARGFAYQMVTVAVGPGGWQGMQLNLPLTSCSGHEESRIREWVYSSGQKAD
jgi:hypothetical protein